MSKDKKFIGCAKQYIIGFCGSSENNLCEKCQGKKEALDKVEAIAKYYFEKEYFEDYPTAFFEEIQKLREAE